MSSFKAPNTQEVFDILGETDIDHYIGDEGADWFEIECDTELDAEILRQMLPELN